MDGEIRESRKAVVLGTLAGWMMRAWCATLRMEIIDKGGLGRREDFPGPLIFAIWHNRIFAGSVAWNRFFGAFRKVVILTSASHDGAMLARAMGVLGFGSVRGSSSRRGVAALVALRKAVRRGLDCAITPDGPRGPRYEVQPGLIKLAETSGAPIVQIHVEFTRVWRLRTWDRFHLPVPFSKVRVIFDEALAVPPKLSEDEFEHWRSLLEQRLRDGVENFQEET